jgi:predicted nuclease of predicted toxin-antitoxin system
MTLWIDAQLSPSLAAWVNENYKELKASSVRALGLRDATDMEIFMSAREANAIIMTKDEDFSRLLDEKGPPPFVIWVTCGNTSNARMRQALEKHLSLALDLIRRGEKLVEISE